MRPPLLATLALLVATPAHARDAALEYDLAQARREKATLRYAEALETLERALARGVADPAAVEEIHRTAGEVAAGLGDDARAIAHFERLLALRPSASLPEGTSPKIAAPFRTARARLAGRALRVRHAAPPGGGAVELVIDEDPAGMVAGARVRLLGADAGAPPVEARGGERIRVPLPPSRRLELVLAALDEHGNELVLLGTPAVPVVVASPGAPFDAPPLLARWETWGVAALVLGAGGTAFALDARAAQRRFDALRADSANHAYEEAEAVERRGRRSATIAVVGLGAAGAAAIVSTALLIRGPTITVAPTSDGLAVGITTRF